MPAPIHVAFSIDTMSVGGTEMNALRTAERLDPSRFRLTVVTLRGDGPLADRYAANGIGFRLSSRVLANSPAVAESLARDDRLGPKRIVVVPNFVDDAAFSAPT